MPERLWRSQDGRERRVGQRDENHLLSAIAMVERGDDWRKIWLPRLYMELAARRCMVPMRMPVSAAEVIKQRRIALELAQEGVKENIRGWVEKLVSERLERASGSSKSTKRKVRSQSARRTGPGLKTRRGTSSSGT